MRSIPALNRLYELSAATESAEPIELVAVEDVVGAQMTRILSSLQRATKSDAIDIWLEVIARLRNLRWRWSTTPAPLMGDPSAVALLAAFENSVCSISPLVGPDNQSIVQCREVLETIGMSDWPPTIDVLLESLAEANDESLSVVVTNQQGTAHITQWLRSNGYKGQVVPRTALATLSLHDQTFFIGSPNLFGSGAVTAPKGERQTFIYPSWISVNSLPEARLRPWVDEPISRSYRKFHLGDTESMPNSFEPNGLPELAPVWPEPVGRSPGPEEVLARKVLLSGGYSLMLDVHGARIRALDASAGIDDRVQHLDVAEVRPGTVLVLRHGTTDSAALLDITRRTLAGESEQVMSSQLTWKSLLRRKIELHGTEWVDRNLRRLGVRVYPRSEDWVRMEVSGPRSDRDFEILLKWLGLVPQEYVEAAHRFRSARSTATSSIRKDLEGAFSKIDIATFNLRGHVSLESDLGHFAGMLATRVIAISPQVEPVNRQDVRIVRRDRSAQWLE